MAREAKEDALAGMSDALEEMTYHNLTTHQGEYQYADTESVCCH